MNKRTLDEQPIGDEMSDHSTHPGHSHVHGPKCGHASVRHGDHVDFLHDGHLHKVHDDHVDECTIAVDSNNPSACTPKHACGGHPANHVHSSSCGHPAVPHGDHVDHLVSGHLHHSHGDHCDDHGPLTAA
jgi:hypothetical protein